MFVQAKFTLKKSYFWHLYLEAVHRPRTVFAINISLFMLIVTAAPNLIFLQNAYSQPELSPGSLSGNLLEPQQQQQLPSLVNNNNNTNASSSIRGNASGDFITIREQYLSSWEGLSFSSAFDTFILSPSVQVYGGYDAKQSNVFEPGDTIILYIEPVGFGHEENIDRRGNPIYSLNITSDITVTDSQGNILASRDVPFDVQNSYRKATELFLVLEIRQDPPFPVGEYVAIYRLTDNITGESFELVKDFRIAEVMRPG